jgi:hypothetical protein
MSANIVAARMAALAVDANLASRVKARVRHLNRELIGAGSAPGIPIDTGQARSSFAWASGHRPAPPFRERKPPAMTHMIPGGFEVDRSLVGYRPGVPIFGRSIISYIVIIAIHGRRPDRRGRMIGSLQAPDGTIKQAIAATAASYGGRR